MKILVTGATGFVGRYVVESLLARGCNVITTSRKEDVAIPCRHIPADLNEPGISWFERFERPHAVIHLAWEGLPNYNELFHIERNLPTSYYFLKNLVESGCKNINVIGTCFEYGLQEGCLSEDLIPKPNTAYGIAKNTLRLFLEEIKKKHDFFLKWIRLFYMHGQGQSKSSILELLKFALERDDKVFNMSGGEQLRDYLPVETIAENIVEISLQNEVQGIINNGSGKPISIRRLVEEYIKQSGKTIQLNLGHYPYTTYEPHAFWADVEKLTRNNQILTQQIRNIP